MHGTSWCWGVCVRVPTPPHALPSLLFSSAQHINLNPGQAPSSAPHPSLRLDPSAFAPTPCPLLPSQVLSTCSLHSLHHPASFSTFIEPCATVHIILHLTTLSLHHSPTSAFQHFLCHPFQ